MSTPTNNIPTSVKLPKLLFWDSHLYEHDCYTPDNPITVKVPTAPKKSKSYFIPRK